jgi:phosphoglycerate dehydrogenase-like enzyme
MSPRPRFKIAILDDYQNVALSMADWSAVAIRAEITVFSDHLAEREAVVKRLEPFDVVCMMRERTPLPREIIERLPRLKVIASNGPVNFSIDMAAVKEHGIRVPHTGYRATPTIEMTWALILASSRHLIQESDSIRAGGWQTTVGQELAGRVLGMLGLGTIGSQVARIALAFGMKVIAWSQNLHPEIAKAAGAAWVTKEELFRQADILTIHLSNRTRSLVGAADLALMKPTVRLINTSRGPIVDEEGLVETLRARSIAGAALDVFDIEPLPAEHADSSSTTSSRRRTLVLSPKIYIGPSTGKRPPLLPYGSTSSSPEAHWDFRSAMTIGAFKSYAHGPAGGHLSVRDADVMAPPITWITFKCMRRLPVLPLPQPVANPTALHKSNSSHQRSNDYG